MQSFAALKTKTKKKTAAAASTVKAAVESTKLAAFAGGEVLELPLANKSLFVKLHRVRKDAARKQQQQNAQSSSSSSSEGEDKTLLVSNVAPDEVTALRPLFESIFNTKVERIDAGKDGGLQRIALVTFAASGVVENKLKHLTCEQTRQLHLEPEQADDEEEADLVATLLRQYKQIRPMRAALAEAADEAVMQVERAAQEAREEQEKQPTVDADGFTLVVSNKRKGAPVPKLPGSNNNSKATQANGALKKKNAGSSGAAAAAKPKSKKRAAESEEDSLKFYKFERKRLRKENQLKLKDQFKLDQQKADRIKAELQQEA